MKKTLAQSLHITPAAGPGPAYTINVSHFDKVINISDNLTDTLRAICNRQGRADVKTKQQTYNSCKIYACKCYRKRPGNRS